MTLTNFKNKMPRHIPDAVHIRDRIERAKERLKNRYKDNWHGD